VLHIPEHGRIRSRRYGQSWERILSKIDIFDAAGCWRWRASKNRSGYGQVGVARKLYLAHRVVYEYCIGPIPKGLELDHLCRTRACVNPFHLEPVTQRENCLRGESFAAKHARKTACPNGHPFDAVDSRGQRICKQCQKAKRRRYYLERGK
jgi:hypothetical protein